MSVRLRLQRHGAKKRPFYRLVATDKRNSRDGQYIELLGTYDPMVEPPSVRINRERVDYWLSVGAQPSDTVGVLIKKIDAPHVVDLSKSGAEETARREKREQKKAAIEARRAETTKAATAAAEAAVEAAASAAVAEEASAEAEEAATDAPAEGGEEA